MVLQAIDLFCGAGGASCGMHQAGVELVAGVDQNEKALETHAANLPGEHIHHDLSDVDTSVLPTNDVDWVHGSPPCQDFSKATFSKRSVDSEKNQLVWKFIDWVVSIDPKYVTMENVTGMTDIHRHFMSHVKQAFREAGYEVRWKVLNAADYGVPQERKRVFCVGVRSDIDAPSRWFPKPTHSPQLQQTLCGETLSPWVNVGDVFPVARADGGVEENEETDPDHILEQPSKTVDTECYLYKRDGGYHNQTASRHRLMSVREAATLQSFPSWYEFPVGVTASRQQIGNAVPPLLQQRIAEHLQAHEAV